MAAMGASSDPKIIVLAGYRGSGKDTVADYLVSAFGYKKYAFADALKDACAEEYRIPRWYFDHREIKELPLSGHEGASPRDMCIEYALAKRAEDDDYFAELVSAAIRDDMDKTPRTEHKYVVSDWRFHNEVAHLRVAFPFGDIRTWYISRFGTPPADHETETQIDPQEDCNYILNNGGNIDFMKEQVNELYLKCL
jgi:hypothetical protein